MEIQEVVIQNDIFRYIEVLGIVFTAVGASIFGYKQFQINKRLQELQDYVAVSIIPSEDARLKISNVGKINLYVHKWEVGNLNEKYENPILTPTDTNSSLLISLHNVSIGENDFKIYITDEKNDKYISTGKVFVEPVPLNIQPQSFVSPTEESDIQGSANGGANQRTTIKVNFRAYSFKTEKYNWNI